MREIKFRAWHKQQKRMLSNDWLLSSDAVYKSMVENNGIELMQYTGLKDKNGKEIYEGDIVNVDNSEPEEKGEFDVTTTCVWENGQLLLMDQAGGSWTRQLYHQPHRLSIIGNIYENAELLSNDQARVNS